MALVVFLRGINVGGFRTYRPSMLAGQLKHLDAVSIGAAGTFVIRQPIGRAQLRAEIASRLPFDAHIMICADREVLAITARDFFPGRSIRDDIVRFVSVLSRIPRSAPGVPLTLPGKGAWLVRVLAREGRFVVGLHRRDMKVIGCLGTLDRIFGVPMTTRSWTTFTAIARVLDDRRT